MPSNAVAAWVRATGYGHGMRALPFAIFLLAAACGRTPDPRPAATSASAHPSEPDTSRFPPGPTSGFETLGPGFEYARLALPDTAPPGDHLVRVVRVDPAVAHVRVEAASVGDRFPRVASAWAGEAPVVAVINAGMFKKDLRTNLGFLRVGDHVQNGVWASKENSLIALDPRASADPRATVADLTCTDKDELVGRYQTLVQSIRMIGCARENVWAPDDKPWSAALTGVDSQGRLLLIFVRSPYTMHALVDMLLALPLDLVALHYGDGGPPASLFVRAPRFEERNVGSVEAAAHAADDNTVEWPLPNVLVVTAGDGP